MWDRLVNRYTILTRPDVGVIVLQARRWRPNRIVQVRFAAGDGAIAHEVPEDVWEQVLAAGSTLEVMAVLRSASGDD